MKSTDTKKIELIRKHCPTFRDLSDNEIVTVYNNYINSDKHKENKKVISFFVRDLFLNES